VLFNDSLGGAFDSQSDIREVVDMTTRNYALYGINVEYVNSGPESIDPDLLTGASEIEYPLGSGDNYASDLLTLVQSDRIQDRFGTQPDVFVFFDNDTVPYSDSCFGRSLADGVDRDEQAIPTLLCTGHQKKDINQIPNSIRSNLTEEEQLRLLTMKTLVHELGHAIDAGELDDNKDEVYSGDPGRIRDNDPTTERIILEGSIERRWSIMANGKFEAMFADPMNGTYFAFSLEELLSTRSDEDDDG